MDLQRFFNQKIKILAKLKKGIKSSGKLEEKWNI